MAITLYFGRPTPTEFLNREVIIMDKQELSLSPEQVYELLDKEYSEIKRIETKIAFIKAHCTHNYEYESDPSGNNDSGYYCQASGSWRKRLP